jgi:hypothetical protein
VAKTDTRNKAASIDDVDRDIAKEGKRGGKERERKDHREGSEKRIRHRSGYKERQMDPSWRVKRPSGEVLTS